MSRAKRILAGWKRLSWGGESVAQLGCTPGVRPGALRPNHFLREPL